MRVKKRLKNCEGGGKILLRLSRLCCLMAAAAFFLQGGTEVQAAEKKLPLVNLAEGNTSITVGDGMTIASPEKMTDGDKYNLKYNDSGNKVNNRWEPYVEADAVTTVTGQQGQPVWIQLDLGAEYPIEVINMKRRVYQGTPGDNGNQSNCRVTGTKYTYQDTAIVIGSQPDLSDGEVIYYSGNVTLPNGVEAPDAVSNAYTEAMGGQWFYMDYSKENGLGITPLGTVKTARYVRVYSRNPLDSNVDFMELAVYGYENAQSVQHTTGKRKQIDNEHPLMIAAAYSSDTYTIGQEENVGLQGWNTIAGRWNAIPDDLKDNNVLMMHSNNLRSFAPDHVGQATVEDYYGACLREGYEAGASVMLMLINASAVPGGAHWCITRDVDEHWVDLMFRMYPNMEGVFSTENFWSGYLGTVAASLARMLEIADLHGGYVVYSEGGHNTTYDQLMGTNALKEAVKKYGDSIFFTYKNTQGSTDGLHQQSALMGSWLAGYIGGWGMLSDTWAWGNSGNGDLWRQQSWNTSMWNPVCGEPEAIFGMQMLSAYLNGGVIYTFEFPEVVYGSIDEKSPAYAHVVERVFRYICENPAPDRKQVLNNTKAIIYGYADNGLYSKTIGQDNAMVLMANGRYGAIPTIPKWGSQEEVTQKLRETAKKEGASAPAVIKSGDGLLSFGAEEYFKSLYPIEYLGDAFADKYNEAWYIYNNSINTDVTQEATLALEAEEAEGTARFTADLQPHTFFVMEERADNSIQISLNNYRISKTDLVFNNSQGWNWNGSSATGQGVSAGKLSVYRYTAYYNAVNAKTGLVNKENPGQTIDQRSPVDNELRTSTFKISSLTSAPTVQVIDGQKPDTDGQIQYKLPVVNYDAVTKTATITIESNGWVDFKVTDLHYEVNPDAVKIADPTGEEEDEYGPRENLALNKAVTASKDPSLKGAGMNRPLTLIVDGHNSLDGEPNTLRYSDPGSDDGGPVWVQIDLGNQHKVDEVKLYRYYTDNRQYYNTIVMLSPDENFASDKTLVLWNANGTNGGYQNQTIAAWTDKDGVSHSVPAGDEPLYAEQSEGKSFRVWDDTVEWLDGDKVREKPGQDEYFDARYVRVYMNGSKVSWGDNRNNSNHLVEVEVFGLPNLADPPGGSENLALRSAVSASNDSSGDRALSKAIDGSKDNCNEYTDPGANDGGPQWVELDLGMKQDVEKVVLYRYWNGGRSYYNTVVMLSPDKNFPAESTLVLWNGDGASGGRDGAAVAEWPGDGNGNKGTHSLPQGSQAIYQETSSGKTFNVYDSTAGWLDPNKTDPTPGAGGRFNARYVRVYMNGSTAGATNHVVEIEVFGEAGEFVLEDTEAPEQVTGLEVEKNYPRRAVIAFLPSMDNMGLKEYQITAKKADGSQERTITLNQTRFELTGLEPGTEYEVSVTATDNFDNVSEPSEPLRFTTPLESDFVVSADLESGTYLSVQQVRLNVPLAEGDIYYTLTGDNPFDEQGNPIRLAVKYSGDAIEVNRSCVLSAALKTGDDTWPASSYNYQIGVQEDADFDAPAAPEQLTADDISSTSASVTWSSSSPDVKAYYIYVDGVKKAEVSVDEAVTKKTFTGLTPLTAYRVYITAVDEAGNESLRSETIEFVTREP